MPKTGKLLTRLHFVVIKAQTGQIDPYLTSQYDIEFQQGDKIVADVEIELSPAEQEVVAAALAETDERLSSGVLLGNLAEKIFLAGYRAGAGLGRRE